MGWALLHHHRSLNDRDIVTSLKKNHEKRLPMPALPIGVWPWEPPWGLRQEPGKKPLGFFRTEGQRS